MANIEFIKEVVAHIEHETTKENTKLHFDMDDWYTELNEEAAKKFDRKCGTNMCFAGWTVHYFDAFPLNNMTSADLIATYATTKLELSYQQGDKIYYSDDVETVDELKARIEEVLGKKIWSEGWMI